MENKNNNYNRGGYRSRARNFGGGSYGRSRPSYGRGYSSNSRRRFGGRKSARSTTEMNESMFIKRAVAVTEQPQYNPTFIFTDLNVDQTLKRNIDKKGFKSPTPIQDQAIPHITDGKDLVGIANTGTGKTAAFLIPLIQKVIDDKKNKVIIIVPTRELAEQINDELYFLTRDLKVFSVECIGGARIDRQINNIQRGFSFIVGTPGRLKDLLERKVLDMKVFSTVVLDEVDRMLDMGFIEDIKYLISFLPQERQSLFFSATIDNKVERVMEMILKKNFVKVSVKTGETAANVHQDVIRVDGREDKFDKLVELLDTDNSVKKSLIFVNTKRGVDALSRKLRDRGYNNELIHGDRRQRERQRAIDSFKSGYVKILIATDVAARGLDISNVSHVINFDIPENYDDYIHRIGRTGRGHNSGIALTFVERKTR